jgi:HlyD family secretion protein
MSTELDSELKETSFAPPADDFPLAPPSRSRRAVRAALWVGGVVLVLAVLGVLISRRMRAAPQIHYETAAADTGTIAAKVTATGNLSALLTVQVGAQVSGRVQELSADYNSPVHKGEIIAKLDPLLFQAAVEQSNAFYLTAQSNLKKDQAQATNMKAVYDRAKNLLVAQVISPQDLDLALANNDAAQAQVEADMSTLQSAKAALNQAQVNLNYTTIISPIDGTVISRSVDVGQTVAASLSAPTLFVIAQDLRKMQVDTNVGEADVGRLIGGMPSSFTVDAYPGKPFVGKLRQIRNAAQTVQNVVTYDAVIDVENPELLLRPGMTANCTFVAAQKDNVVRLRNAALRFQPDPQLLQRLGFPAPTPTTTAPLAPNRRTVWVLRDNKPVSLLVSIGVSDGTWTEMTEGDVKPGDVLITDMSVVARTGLF